ncbi:MAG: redoxin family protein [Acidobacteriota bacterium]
MRIVRYLLMAAAVLGLAASLGYIAFQPSSPAIGPVAAGTPSATDAPLSVTRLDGSTMLLEELKGEIVILDFWATWCGPCITEIPHYNQLDADYRDKGVHLLGVTLQSGTIEEVTAFAADEAHRISYPLVLGNDGIVGAYGPIWGFPTTLLIDRQGKVVKRWLGADPRKNEQLRELLDDMLEG